MRESAAARILRLNGNATFPLQITTMIDMFTIILVFLLKSYSASAINIVPNQNMALPVSSSTEQPIEALKLMVTKDGIFVDDKPIVTFQNGDVPASAIDPKDSKFIRTLYDALNKEAQKTKDIGKQNETVQFEGKIIFQADQNLNYQLLRKVMYTATLAGYADFKFAVVSP